MKEPAPSDRWLRAADGHLLAARVLLAEAEREPGPPAEACTRGCLSRAYYAAYSACCGWFQVTREWFAAVGDPAPVEPVADDEAGASWYRHRDLEASLGKLMAWRYSDCQDRDCGPEMQRACCGKVALLRQLRVDADYRPDIVPQPADARDAVRVAAAVVEWVREQVARVRERE